ncbi:hypothetical protein GTH52_12245 [Clostridium tyrobutyricum]|uniref:Exported protein n=1 Tax=Clostridium tyrobutyricum DIVETGP TaxID=1408889 RepID=W6NFK5_CLOTY|nr:hypothetical protein [Clostridium tyrobutyricum]AND86266.1 hypothetical protein CTK_C30280 [Clostridium tyrobutyricum]ANP70756.1 hypothetical protein BA182_14130 [Clostridium tyrobutyricum]MBV4417678.1 DUF1574 domain-containing protein [Clostridium tyrobutyricum]MBV4423566.1 DUF1574 domain-containing protein [Clostridium tyrobutyricum]MBV4435713.1 DUF1574 domain-containing protein [Clostridium tyrobutyricum]
MIKKAVIKGVVFITFLLIIINIITPAFILKTSHRGKLIEGLYNHTGNSYDVVLMGGSHMNGGIDPNVLWHNYGITSFNYATGGQSIDVTYYMLKEILKKHKVSIAVVDAYYLARTAEYGDKGYISNAVDNMKFSINKLETIQNCIPFEDRLSYLLPILKYHNRWKELTKKDFNYSSDENYYAKGFEAGTNRYGKNNSTENVKLKKIYSTVALPPKSLIYLNKIIKLCKDNNLKLILLNTPFDYNSEGNSNDWSKQQPQLFKKVSEIANQNNIPFINYNDMLDEIKFDFKNEMNNSGHVNIWGASKVTMDFGDYLKKNYNLENHRKDVMYKQWDIDYKYSQVKKYVNNKS